MQRTVRISTVIPVLIVIIALGGLLVAPFFAAPIMFIVGFAWRSGPRWARVTLVTAACLFGAYFLMTQPVGTQ
jgi:hypothetical protein